MRYNYHQSKYGMLAMVIVLVSLFCIFELMVSPIEYTPHVIHSKYPSNYHLMLEFKPEKMSIVDPNTGISDSQHFSFMQNRYIYFTFLLPQAYDIYAL